MNHPFLCRVALLHEFSFRCSHPRNSARGSLLRGVGITDRNGLPAWCGPMWRPKETGLKLLIGLHAS